MPTDSLTPGERAVRCFLGEPVDHVPFGVGLGWLPWNQATERWAAESGKPDLDPARELGFEPSFAVPEIQAGLFPGFAPTVLEEDETTITRRNEQGITMRVRRDGLSMPQFLEYPVKTQEDWEQIKAERLDPAAPGRLPQDWDAFRDRLRLTGEGVQVGCYPYGVFGTPRDLMGTEDLLLGFYLRPEMIHDMMDHLTGLWISLWERVANEVQIDHIHIWEDMSGKTGSLISPQLVREFMMPCYDRIKEFARRAGVRIISVDTDGDCSQLIPIMMEHGMNMMFPFEVQAGNDVLTYRRQYPTLGITGGLDKRALAGTRAELDREIDRAGELIRAGRYIPGFDHMIPPDVPWENFAHAAHRIRELCYRGSK